MQQALRSLPDAQREAIELAYPLRVWRSELRRGSGAPDPRSFVEGFQNACLTASVVLFCGAAFAAVILVPILVFTIWTWSALTWSYSAGERAGYVQKFSKRGWVCKTWEGELAMVNIPGAMQEKFQFSVRDDLIARHILASMGKRVTLTYQQHKGVPTDCFGETEYFVTSVKVLE